ncbi:MAG: CotH kinase family protein [Bacteroidota bacterium]
MQNIRPIVVFVFLFLLVFNLPAQVVINEVSSASVSGYLDEDSDQEDWIEFYNTSTLPVNLKGYTITVKENGKTYSWAFPSIIIKPLEYLTVFCSKKDRKAYFDHWEVPVIADQPWKYFPGTTDPPSNWRSVSFNDTSWPTGNGGIGYGDADDATTIPSNVNSVFMRQYFNIADTSKIVTGLTLLDYDDAFVAYLNDVEIARSNIGIYGDHPPYDASAYDEHEATNYQTGEFSGFAFVSPQLIDSALKQGTNVFSIQVHNYSGATGIPDLTALPYLLIGVNDTTVTYFPFPAKINLHTNFNLNSTGQTIILTDASGNIKDEKNIGAMTLNNTYGRRPNGANNWYYFDTPTPDTTNNVSAYYTGYASKPTFALPSGFYTGTKTLGLAGAGTGVIRYTLDGKDPDQSSALYTAPITINSTTVVRARTYSSDPLRFPSEIITNTYFINENISLPVVSLVSDPYNLFDHNYGIYVYGPGADTFNMPFPGSNFWKGWERPANIEFFDQGGKLGFETPTGIAIQGNYSKAWPQRGFAVRTKENYKGETIDYPLFPSKPNITQYKSFNIRNAGSDWNTCHMRDRFNQENAQKSTSLDMMDGRPCVLFINGDYWGVYELREKQDKNYIENNSGIPADKIDFLQFDGDIIEGSNTAFLNMSGFIGNNNMNIAANYSKAKEMLDIENFCDYIITETYIMNVDWLGTYTNNIKFWRPSNPPGKWRYVLWDTDLSLGFGQSLGMGSVATNFLNTAINPTTPNPHSTMLKGLLNNTEFKNYFVNRYADLMNTVFQPSQMRSSAYALRDEMLPEMARHFTTWQSSALPGIWENFIGRSKDVNSWNKQIDTMLLFTDSRLSHSRDTIQKQFSLVKQVDVTLDVFPKGAGTIKISTITPETLPWAGVYYDGVPVTITAKPNPGYEFKYWADNNSFAGSILSAGITLNISNDDTFTAHFDLLENGLDVYPNPFYDKLTINYQLPSTLQVSIKLYSILGQEAAELVSPTTFQPEGSYSIDVDITDLHLTQGVYFMRLRTKEYMKTVKVIYAK